MSEWAIIDPHLTDLLEEHDSRQANSINLVASASHMPLNVKRALTSSFMAVNPEGYPPPWLRKLTQTSERPDWAQVRDEYLRRGDRRYFGGTDLVSALECLAEKRAAEALHTNTAPAQSLLINVEALSGSIANTAIQNAILRPGDCVLSMAMSDGGHLSHSSPLHISGQLYRGAYYGTELATGELDYDNIRHLAQQIRPRLIIAGGSSYPLHIDWQKLRCIADAIDPPAFLLADVSHPAGMVATGLYPSPVGTADLTMFTTYKTFCGPHAAVIATCDTELDSRVRRALAPGLQSGPYSYLIAGLAAAFNNAVTAPFYQLQERILQNARILAGHLARRGVPLAFSTTETHMVLIDLKPLGLQGEAVSRLLDAVGIICNKNLLRGDRNVRECTGVRLGTTIISQMGLGTSHVEQIADTIADVVHAVPPISNSDVAARNRQTIPYSVFRRAREIVQDLLSTTRAGGSSSLRSAHNRSKSSVSFATYSPPTAQDPVEIRGERAAEFLNAICLLDIAHLTIGQSAETTGLNCCDCPMSGIRIRRVGDDIFHVQSDGDETTTLYEWLRGLSAGIIQLGHGDTFATAPGPVQIGFAADGTFCLAEPQRSATDQAVLSQIVQTPPDVNGEPPASSQLNSDPRTTALYKEHLRCVPLSHFRVYAGWTTPLYYASIAEEHQATRKSAGLFDLGHMGLLGVEGRQAARFVDHVTTSNMSSLENGEARYAFVLDPNGNVLDDVIVYRLSQQRFIVVTNSVNSDRVLAWLWMVLNNQVADVGREDDWMRNQVQIRDLSHYSSYDDRLTIMALQGPMSAAVLLRVLDSHIQQDEIGRLRRFEHREVTIGERQAIVARTGYTGEDIGYEILVHPVHAAEVWNSLLRAGSELSIRPAGLAARDSLRIEAGLPLFGSELGGLHNVSPIAAGYAHSIQFMKPSFVGREQLLRRELVRDRKIIRFKGIDAHRRPLRPGDVVTDARGKRIGFVTSATVAGGVHVGMAYVDLEASHLGTEICIFRQSRDHQNPFSLEGTSEPHALPIAARAWVAERFERFGIASHLIVAQRDDPQGSGRVARAWCGADLSQPIFSRLQTMDGTMASGIEGPGSRTVSQYPAQLRLELVMDELGGRRSRKEILEQYGIPAGVFNMWREAVMRVALETLAALG